MTSDGRPYWSVKSPNCSLLLAPVEPPCWPLLTDIFLNRVQFLLDLRYLLSQYFIFLSKAVYLIFHFPNTQLLDLNVVLCSGAENRSDHSELKKVLADLKIKSKIRLSKTPRSHSSVVNQETLNRCSRTTIYLFSTIHTKKKAQKF